MPAPDARPAPLATDRSDDVDHERFRAVHASSIHGFALLLVLGDRARAGMLAASAIEAAREHGEELRHPERAAAWLRRTVVRSARGRAGALDDAARLAALHDLGVTAPGLAGLASLESRERAALVAADVERLGESDVGIIVDRSGRSLAELLSRARATYLSAAVAAADDRRQAGPAGPTRTRIASMAARIMP